MTHPDTTAMFVDAVVCGVNATYFDKALATTLKAFSDGGYSIHLVLDHTESVRTEVVNTLNKTGAMWDTLRLYSETDFLDLVAYKASYIEYLRERGFRPILFIEDRCSTASTLKNTTGMPVLVFNPC